MGKVSKSQLAEARKAEARERYEARLRAGLQMNPPFKGLGIAFIWFAMDEPELFKLIMQDTASESIQDFIDTHVGFKEECVSAIRSSTGLSEENAAAMYYETFTLGLGMAFAVVEGHCPLNIREASEMLGRGFRAFLLEINAGADERIGFIPQKGAGPRGSVDSYVDKGMEGIRRHAHLLMLNTLVSQNRLLQELHEAPRYILDTEWTELERVLRHTFEITPASLKECFPVLTPGDIRLILLSRFQFGVAESALLLGISATSVTKARQRLKTKLGIESIEAFLDTL